MILTKIIPNSRSTDADLTEETAGFVVKIQGHEVDTTNYGQHILSITCEQIMK